MEDVLFMDTDPGICRLFPLGRIYEENGFKYFIQVHECKKQERGKVKIKKWLELQIRRDTKISCGDGIHFLRTVKKE